MRLRVHFIARGLALSPMVAAAEPIVGGIKFPKPVLRLTFQRQSFPNRLESRKQDTGAAFSLRTGAPI
jgi:hypothetical protein